MAPKSAYIANAFLLTLPILFWNSLLGDMLPAVFQTAAYDIEVPRWIRLGEQAARVLFFAVAYLIPLNYRAPQATAGLLFYAVGVVAYFGSWTILVVAPDSDWALSFIGFTAPAWTPAIWMAGICLSGNRFSFGIPFRRWIPAVASTLFLTFHVTHAAIAYTNGYTPSL